MMKSIQTITCGKVSGDEDYRLSHAEKSQVVKIIQTITCGKVSDDEEHTDYHMWKSLR